MDYAISSPTSSGDHGIAWGYYKVTFHLIDSSFARKFYLDLRDANWSMEQPPYVSDPDTYFRWNHSIQKFEFKNKKYTSWTSFSANAHKTIWELNKIKEPSQDMFQPYKPQDFKCTNSNSIGQHPHFEWYWPEQPRFGPDWQWYYKYKIYRKEDNGPYYRVASNLTFSFPDFVFYWTDYGTTISSTGNRLLYYATAYTDQSP